MRGGGKRPNPKLPLPFHPWNGPFWGESGTNTNFWLPTVPADPVLGVFSPNLALGVSSGGGRAGGGCKKHPRDPPPKHTLSAPFLGGKAAESDKPPDGRGFPPVFGGDLGSGGAHMPRPGGSPRSPHLPTPQIGRNRPKSAAPPLPHPARVPGGSGWGEGRARYLPPPIWGGFASISRLPPHCSLLHLLVLGTKV